MHAKEDCWCNPSAKPGIYKGDAWRDKILNENKVRALKSLEAEEGRDDCAPRGLAGLDLDDGVRNVGCIDFDTPDSEDELEDEQEDLSGELLVMERSVNFSANDDIQIKKCQELFEGQMRTTGASGESQTRIAMITLGPTF